MNPLPSKPDPRDVEAVRAAIRPRLMGITDLVARAIEREGVDLSERKERSK